ncbi:hypothetical protein ASPBRDRAFT_50762 [Aspergillus brasiliensis CBS 101740]|uniref:LysM domain-containing protein n=1 Tax=Aspergillus brasiliensis (strain CBS 101740 / IMI 381727 / IBT 21946) TaxID=767769 RepID=A0A1L9V203_ASPBC|nr:hypothetical protein ASPBRDRAFT_50762 [Aspergillus brasiliensis CBS 101740]
MLGDSVEGLQQLNPGITCPGLDPSKSYCVIGTVNDDVPSTTLTTTMSMTTPSKASDPTTTTSTVSAPTNSPTMPGIVGNCDGFYKVSSGDHCGTIAQAYGISTAQLLSWNSEIDDNCTNLWLDYYICVHVPGTTTTTPAAPDPTNDPSGPTPQLPGIVEDCKSFHLVKDGDNCYSISSDAGIMLAQLRQWNTEIDAAWNNLWLGYYRLSQT